MRPYFTKKTSTIISGYSVSRSQKTLLVVSLGLLAVIMGFSPAGAEDGKLYPGSMCVRYAGTSTPSYNFSAIGNPSTSSWLYVDCPVVHDSMNHSIRNGYVNMIDMNYSSNVRCSLNSFYRSGGSWYGWWSPSKSSSGSGSSPQRIYYSGLGSNSSSHYYYSCQIPPRYSGNTSYLGSYYVSEND